MKKIYTLFFLATGSLCAQNVAINNTGAVANSNAILDVDVSTNDKGVLIPRLTTAQRTAIAGLGAVDEGLVVYDETTNTFWYWDGTQWVEMATTAGAGNNWQLTGNTGTNATTNFVGTTDNVDFVIRTNNTEKVRVLTNGNVGIGTAAPAYRLDLANGTFGFGNANQRTETRNNAGLQGNAGAQSGFFETSVPVNYPTGASSWWHLIDVRHSNTANNYALQIAGSFFDQDLYFRKTNNNAATGWSRLLTGTTGWTILGNPGTNPAINFVGTTDPQDFVTRTGNVERMRVTSAGNVGIGTNAPVARLQVTGGAIMPQTGNNTLSGIYFPTNPGGGGGDEAFIRHYVEAGENTKLVIANYNDADDDIAFNTGAGYERVQINGQGTVYFNRSVFFDCNDCGSNTAYDLADGTGGNWGDMSIQGRVISANNNIHLSPPGGSRVIINSTYRAAGGGGGQVGLDVDGGIRMRKNYMYFQRYRYCNCYGAGAATWGLGNWDFCAVAHVGFKNNQSTTDEDDDVQCAVYPAGAGAGEQTNYDYYYTEQFNTRRAWTMYLEAYEDTNGVTCAATCMNFD